MCAYNPKRAEPTQVKYPWRAGIRTGIVTVISVLGVITGVVAIVQDEAVIYLGDTLIATLGWIAGLAATIATILTRILALPGVDDALTAGFNAGAEPR